MQFKHLPSMSNGAHTSNARVSHGSNFNLNSKRFDRFIAEPVTPKSGETDVKSEFDCLKNESEPLTVFAKSMNHEGLIDGRFEVISKADGSIASFQRFISDPASKSPKTVGHLSINGLHIRKAMKLFAEMCAKPRIRVENFGHGGYSTYALYQNAEGRVFLTEMIVQTLSSFIEITSDEMLASCR